jgi:hypothetical protein
MEKKQTIAAAAYFTEDIKKDAEASLSNILTVL